MQQDRAALYPHSALPQVNESAKSPPAPGAAAAPMQTMLLLGPENTVTVCPFCHASIKTAVQFTTTTRTHIAAVLCGIFCCLCCVPYCSESAKNSDHFCPNCERYLGTYKK